MQPIHIFKGDSTIFADSDKFLTFNIKTELDLTGWKAQFKLGKIVKICDDISSKTFTIILTCNDTSTLEYGPIDGILKFIDAENNCKTISNKIPFIVDDKVVENDCSLINIDGSKWGFVIEVKIGTGTKNYEELCNKPSINGIKLVGDKTLEELGIQPAGELVEVDPTVPDWAKQPEKPTYTAEEVGALPITTVIPDISDITDLQTGLSEVETKTSEIQTEVSDVKTNVANVQESITNVQNDITTIEGDITDIEGNITTIQNGIIGLNTDIDKVKDSVATIDENIDTLEGDVRNLQNITTETRNEVSTLELNVSDIQEVTTQNTANITNLQSGLETANQQISDLETNVTNIQGDITDIQGSISDIETALEDKADKVHTHEISDVNNLQDELDKIVEPLIINIPIRTLQDKVYDKETILGWFNVTSDAELKGFISRNNPIYLKYGINLSYNPHFYKFPVEYIAYETANQIKLVFQGLDTSDDTVVKYQIIINLDGTLFGDTQSNVSLELLPIGSDYTLPIASTTTLGGIKVDNDTIVISEDGTITAIGTEVTDVKAQNVEYINGEFTTVQQALDSLLYVAPVIKSFNGGGTYEMGQTINEVNLSWSINKEVQTQSLNQGIGSIDASLRSYKHSGVNITNNTTYTLTVSDGTNSVSRNTSINFRQKRYWGTSTKSSLTKEDILAMSQEFSTSRAQTRTFDCSGGKYFYFVIPSQYCNGISFKVGGLAFSAMSSETIQLENASGYTSSYNVYRPINIQTGSAISVEVL